MIEKKIFKNVSTIVVSLFLTSCSFFHVSNVPTLDSFAGQTLKICCESSSDEHECRPDYWKHSANQYCDGKPVLRSYMAPVKGSHQSCAIYSCQGQIKTYQMNACSTRTIRSIGLDLILDQSFLNDLGVNWKNELKNKIAYLNGYMQELKIQFYVSSILFEKFTLKSLNMEKIFVRMDELKNNSKGEIQVAILSNKLKDGRIKVLEGVAKRLFGNQLIVSSTRNQFISSVLAHELGHLFGALHVPDENALMYQANHQYRSRNEISQATRQIFKITKCLDFKKGIVSLSGPQMALLIETYKHFKKDDFLKSVIFFELFYSVDDVKNNEIKELQQKLVVLNEAFPQAAEWNLLLGVWHAFHSKNHTSSAAYLRQSLNLKITRHISDYHLSVDGTARLNYKDVIDYYLALSLMGMQNIEDAKKILKNLTVKYPKFLAAYLRLGDCYTSQNNLQKAEEYYKKAKKIKQAD